MIGQIRKLPTSSFSTSGCNFQNPDCPEFLEEGRDLEIES